MVVQMLFQNTIHSFEAKQICGIHETTYSELAVVGESLHGRGRTGRASLLASPNQMILIPLFANRDPLLLRLQRDSGKSR